LLVSCGAWCATLPILAWQFHSISLVAPLANLIVVPWSSLLMAVGLVVYAVSFPAGWIVPSAMGPMIASFTFLARGLTAWTNWAASLPGVYWEW